MSAISFIGPMPDVVQVIMLRRSLDMQQQGMANLLQVMPPAPARPPAVSPAAPVSGASASGGGLDRYA